MNGLPVSLERPPVKEGEIREGASTLIITAHPDPESLTHKAALRLEESIGEDAVMASLAQENFDPRFTLKDRQVYRDQSRAGQDVLAEQQRVDAADHLVLVFPVYWWSMPAILKGWFDRIFIEGWAFGIDETGRIVPSLGRLTIHLLPVTGTTSESFERHGYAKAFATQINNGILNFCGAQPGTTAFIHDSESDDQEAIAGEMEAAVCAITQTISSENRRSRSR